MKSLYGLFLFIAFHVCAQDTTTVRALDEVVITANKYPTKTTSTGKVVSVVTRRQLEQSGGKDLSQILNEQAGLYLNGANSNPGKDKSLFLRGAKADHTLILIDGVPVYDASGIGSNFDIRQIPIDHIERIEILKGSQSTLYGSDAIAGVINIITRKGLQNPFGMTGKLSYGSYNTLRSTATLHANTPSVDYSLAYSYNRSDGINETVDTSHTIFRQEKDGFTQHNLNATAGWSPSEKIHISPYFRLSTLHADIDQGAFTEELDFVTTLKNWQAGVRSVMDFKKVRLNFLYNYNDIDREYIDDSVKSRNGFATFSRTAYQASEHFADVFMSIPLNQKIRLTTGTDLRSANTGQQIFSLSSFGPFISEIKKDTAVHNQFAVYANALMNNDKGFSMELGGRWNNHSEYGSNFVYNLNPSVLLNEKLKVFLNISSGYKTPSLYQLYSEFGNRSLKPEEALTFEAGVQLFTKNDKINIRGTYFNRNVDDVIAFVFNPTTFRSFYINQDNQEDQGFEIESFFKPSDKLSLRLNYSYVDGTVRTRNNGKDTTFFNLFRRPKHTVALNIGSQLTTNLFVSTQLQSFSKRYDQVYDAFFNLVNVEMDGFILWDIYTEYSFGKKFKVFAELRNLLDQEYQEVYGYASPGRNGYLGVRVSL